MQYAAVLTGIVIVIDINTSKLCFYVLEFYSNKGGWHKRYVLELCTAGIYILKTLHGILV